MSWISGLVSGIGAGANVRGNNQAAGKMNKYYDQMFGPSGVNAAAYQYNPYIWDAIKGQRGTTGFQGDLYKIAQGQDISPYLLNQPLNQVNQGANRNMAAMTAQLGRSNMSGGLANAYALSNQMGRQNSTANLYQNYGQWRESQRRSDLDWLMGQMHNSQEMGFQGNQAQAGAHTFKKNFWQKLGAFGQAFGAGMGGGMGGGGGQQQQPQGNSQAMNPNFDSNNQYGDWTGNTSGWGQGSSWGGGTMTGPQTQGQSYGQVDPRVQMGSGSVYGTGDR